MSGRPRQRSRSPRSARLPDKPGRERLKALFARSGLPLAAIQVEQFWTFHQLLQKHNEELDLTRLHGFDSIVLELYVDSALVATFVDLPSPLVDLGSGPGVPGIPLKIVRPDVRMILAAARRERVGFLEEAIDALGLRDVQVVPHRIGRPFTHPVRGVIMRSLESMPAMLERVSGWLEPGARVLFMRSPRRRPEEDALLMCDSGRSFRVTRDTPYAIPETRHERRLVVLECLDPGPSAGNGAATDAGAAGPERQMRDIRSEQSTTFRLLRSLRSGRGIRKAGLALIAGMRAIHEILREYPEHCVAWISSGPPAPPPEAPAALAWYRLAPRLFREADVSGTGPPLLLVRVPELPAWTDSDWPPGCTLFIPFQDPENVGAVLRSAAAFGAARVVLLEEAAHPFHPRSARSSGGAALFRVPLLRGPSIRTLRVEGAPLLALSTSGSDIGTHEFPPTFGLLPGLEGPGLPEALRTPDALHIPMASGNESLNAATAAGIALYLWSRRSGGRARRDAE
ncbi:MAG: RsmG family class I SAM-dependent methyltransferase [Candidatus Krumholzibacteriia bacterium]